MIAFLIQKCDVQRFIKFPMFFSQLSECKNHISGTYSFSEPQYCRCCLYKFSDFSSFFSTSSSSSVVVSLFVWVICSSNSFLMFCPFGILCKLTRFVFSPGFSFWMICLVCITTNRWSQSSETGGIALKLKCRQYPAIHTIYSLSNCTISN